MFGRVLVSQVTQFVESADVDNDGDLDLVVTTMTLQLRYFTTLKVSFRKMHHNVYTYVRNTSDISIGDLNQDGYLDIVSASQNRKE